MVVELRLNSAEFHIIDFQKYSSPSMNIQHFTALFQVSRFEERELLALIRRGGSHSKSTKRYGCVFRVSLSSNTWAFHKKWNSSGNGLAVGHVQLPPRKWFFFAKNVRLAKETWVRIEWKFLPPGQRKPTQARFTKGMLLDSETEKNGMVFPTENTALRGRGAECEVPGRARRTDCPVWVRRGHHAFS